VPAHLPWSCCVRRHCRGAPRGECRDEGSAAPIIVTSSTTGAGREVDGVDVDSSWADVGPDPQALALGPLCRSSPLPFSGIPPSLATRTLHHGNFPCATRQVDMEFASNAILPALYFITFCLSTKANLGTRARYHSSELAPSTSEFRFEFRRVELLLSL